MPTLFAAFATCPKGLESLLREELPRLGATDLKETVAGVGFTGDLECLYRICLWSRLANRILLVLDSFAFEDPDGLYSGVKSIAWDAHMAVTTTFAIDFSGKTEAIKHSHFGALKVKDAIADYFRDRSGNRPSVDPERPALRVNVRAARGTATVSIDLCGESLHKRGYRLAGGAAPLKENLAAALLIRAGWTEGGDPGGTLLDPMCGSGTLLIEGAFIAAGLAPGEGRDYWGFAGWSGHRQDIWDSLLAEARERRAMASALPLPRLIGYDASGHVVQMAEKNIRAAGFTDRIRVRRGDLATLTPPAEAKSGLLITNPPFGERLGSEDSLRSLYRHLGERLTGHFQGWQAAIITGNPELGKTMGIRARKIYRFFNGAVPARLLLFDVQPASYVQHSEKEVPPVTATLSPGAQMVANRLKKNVKRLARWSRNGNIECYRVYDADIPEYATAIDRYRDWVHVSEYQAPASIDPAVAARRLDEVVAAIQSELQPDRERIVVKQRKRQRGTDQYQKQGQREQLLEIREHGATLLVNLHDYLDTGLFLDHRPVRKRIGDLAGGKRFLNLYCYTAAATVCAALGGARFSTSVDLSPRYLDWARKNLARNGFDETRHKLVEADCQKWLSENDDTYDLVLLDPPTFSNSKRTPNVLDLQRDHVALLDAAMHCLSEDGLLIFSTNRRNFKLDNAVESDFSVLDATRWSLDQDFKRSKIHRCWLVRHKI